MMKQNRNTRRKSGEASETRRAVTRFRLVKNVLVGTTIGVGGLLAAAGCIQMADAQDVLETRAGGLNNEASTEPEDGADSQASSFSAATQVDSALNVDSGGSSRSRLAVGFSALDSEPARVNQSMGFARTTPSPGTHTIFSPGSSVAGFPQPVQTTRLVPRQETVQYWDADTGQARTKTVTRYVAETFYGSPSTRVKPGNAIGLEIASLVEDINRTPREANDEQVAKLEENLDKLKGLLGKEFDRMHDAQQDRIDELSERLKKLQDTQDARKDARDEIIDRRIIQLTQQADPLAWDPNEAQGNYFAPKANTYTPVPGQAQLPRFPQPPGYPQTLAPNQGPSTGFLPTPNAPVAPTPYGSSSSFRRANPNSYPAQTMPQQNFNAPSSSSRGRNTQRFNEPRLRAEPSGEIMWQGDPAKAEQLQRYLKDRDTKPSSASTTRERRDRSKPRSGQGQRIDRDMLDEADPLLEDRDTDAESGDGDSDENDFFDEDSLSYTIETRR